MTCASCANRIERKLNKLDGVTATVNYATEKAKVDVPRERRPRPTWCARSSRPGTAPRCPPATDGAGDAAEAEATGPAPARCASG